MSYGNVTPTSEQAFEAYKEGNWIPFDKNATSQLALNLTEKSKDIRNHLKYLHHANKYILYFSTIHSDMVAW